MKKEDTNSQIQSLRRLKQGAAAYLIGYTSARSLRDAVDVPRNEDGTYDARAVFQWAQGRYQRPQVPEETIERLIVAAEDLSDLEGYAGEWYPFIAFFEELDRLRSEHGDAGAVAVLDSFLSPWRDRMEWWIKDHGHPRDIPEPTEAEVREETRTNLREKHERLRHYRNEVVMCCEYCKRYRVGRNWQVKNPHEDWYVKGHVCPDCETNS